jgi:phospholipase C
LIKRLAAAAASFALAACGARATTGGAGGLLPAQDAVAPGHYVSHVVIMVQENRSFDNFFATYPGADGPPVKGGTPVGNTPPRKTAHGTSTTYPLKKVDLPEHLQPVYRYANYRADYDGGKMDGFWNQKVQGRPGSVLYQYVDPKQIAPYWSMADQYVLGDHMFQTVGSSSFPSHQDLIAGSTSIDKTKEVVDPPDNMPWGCDAPYGTTTTLLSTSGKYPLPGPSPCFQYRTLRDVLDEKGVSWKYYVPALHGPGGQVWSAFDAIRAVRYGPEWTTNVSSPQTNVYADISKGTLPAVSWVIPDFYNSDHSDTTKDTGPSWVASVVNAIGESQYWSSTVIIVVWDDWGGFYDHVPPPQYGPGSLGFRVPMLIVSPYAKKGYVAHHVYEFGSILKFVESTFGLESLGTTDVRARNFAGDVFQFSKPRKFVPIAVKYSKAFFEHQAPSNLPVDTE